MQTIKLEVEESKIDLVLNIISSLKDDIIKRYEVLDRDKEQEELISISNRSFDEIWNNEEDSIYDKYLK